MRSVSGVFSVGGEDCPALAAYVARSLLKKARIPTSSLWERADPGIHGTIRYNL
jgi:hypothetical protein